MFRQTLLIGIAILGLAGCAPKTAEVPSPQTKVFEAEDMYALFALDAEAHGQYAAAAQFYALLYEKAPRPEYREHFFENLLQAGLFADVIDNVNQIEAEEELTPALERYRIRALIGERALPEAEGYALALLKRTKATQDYLVVAEIYALQKQYNTALRYLESAYDVNYNEAVLDRMAVVLYVNLDRRKDAIAQLETHIRLHGCSERICKRLAGFYSDQNNIEGLLSTYRRLYDAVPSQEIADGIVRIYSYQNDLVRLKQFLEQYHTDDETLIKLYLSAKEYKEASALAQALYEKNGDAFYLGQSAIFAFEGAEDKKTPGLLAEVVGKLKTAVKIDKDPLQLNYLGYLLIDYDIDPAEGIVYVEAALKQEPDSPFYLDSLAWGYYKLGQCAKASELIQKAVEAMRGEEDDELNKHRKAIAECLKGNK